MSGAIRIDATRKERWLTGYNDCGDQALMCLFFFLSLGVAISGLVIGFSGYPFGFSAVILPLLFWRLNNVAEVTADRVKANLTNSKTATDIYNRLNDIYKMPAEPIVKKVYEIENYAMRYCGGLSRGDDRWEALATRMDALRALEEKQKAEIVGPILEDESDLTAARMTLGS